MPGRNPLKTCLSVWIGLAGMCAIAWADAPQVLPGQGVGIMGQVARPGTYVLNSPRLPLSELIREAGGLTQRATGRLRVVRPGEGGLRVAESPPGDFSLQPGDIVVAEGQPSATDESYQQVALVHLIDRPVILPVPTTHANLPAILNYLGQDPSIVRQVQVIPGGVEQAMTHITGPTILDFQSAAVQRLKLPRFPEAYRIEPTGGESKRKFAEVQHEEPDAANRPSLMLSFPEDGPAPPERFQRPGSPAVISPEELSGPVLKPFPEARTEVREVEPSNAAPDVLETPWEMDVPRSKPSLDEENAEEETASSSRWSWVGLVVLALACGGISAKFFWSKRFSNRQITQPPAADISPFIEPVSPSQELPEPPPEEGHWPEDVVGEMDDALAALVFNTLPVVEETRDSAGSARAETKPPSPPQFRVDSLHEPVAKQPYLLNPPARSTIKIDPSGASVPDPPKSAEPPSQGRQEIDTKPSDKNVPPPSSTLSVLDRVLQRVHERRAA